MAEIRTQVGLFEVPAVAPHAYSDPDGQSLAG